ncbi:transcriptional regulator GcvA [Solimonas variicoloris]|uniref:transcriptional regulator GcvA n=1 Tax=Solimonas variicoloris TaxID=254408 RepID=UPI0003823608|nr:transcriptional regulator GcvA [Solimonas variicoloris]
MSQTHARRGLPPLDLLRGFEAAARHLSFTRAAAELSLTQSAVSRQVQALESHLQQPLFERRHRALALTPAGELLLRQVGELLGRLGETIEQIRAAQTARLVTVTTPGSVASLWLLPRLPAFRAAHPQIDVRISADSRVADLTRERIDVAIRFCPPERAPGDGERLFGEATIPVCSPALRADRRRPLRTPADLRRHVLLHCDATSPYPWLAWDLWLETMGLAGLQPAGALRFSHYDQAILAAIDGQGIALGRRPLIDAQLARGQLVVPFARQLRAVVAPRAYYLLVEPAARQRPEVQRFVAWLREQATAA